MADTDYEVGDVLLFPNFSARGVKLVYVDGDWVAGVILEKRGHTYERTDQGVTALRGEFMATLRKLGIAPPKDAPQ